MEAQQLTSQCTYQTPLRIQEEVEGGAIDLAGDHNPLYHECNNHDEWKK